jgi:pimeloyl-ACP methyl ester carboxylesterase
MLLSAMFVIRPNLREPKWRRTSTGETALDAFRYLFFSPSERGQAAGKAFWERRHGRKKDVDRPSSARTMAAQRAAIEEWRQVRGERLAELKSITQPTLVVNGSNDVMIPTINSFMLSQHIPNAQLIIYPDSGHGSQFQYPELFLSHARIFLDE